VDSTFSFAELRNANATRYDEPEVYGRKVAIGSVNSEDMIDWLESNDDPKSKREAGLRLIVKSVVEVVTRDSAGNITEVRRIPKEQRDEFMQIFREKDARENGLLVRACLKLNGLDRAAAKQDAVKNDSSEVSPAASPTDSPSQPGA
jgi:hypothetical protein